VRVFNPTAPTVAPVEISSDREEPGCEPSIRAERRGLRHQTQPYVFEQILREVAISAQPQEKAEQPGAILLVYGIERRRLAESQPSNECQFGISIHRR
jgi:hypothetical protein